MSLCTTFTIFKLDKYDFKRSKLYILNENKIIFEIFPKKEASIVLNCKAFMGRIEDCLKGIER